MPRWITRPLGVLVVFLTATVVTLAQQQPQPPQQQRSTEVSDFEVVSVNGNHVVAKDHAGTQEYTVPEDFRFTVGSRKISVRELKPGMKGTMTITTTTTVTPVHVTEVRNGEVIQVSANSMIIRGPEGFRMFSAQDIEKSSARIFKDGQPVAFSALSVGDRLTATIVTNGQPKVVTDREVQATLNRPPASVARAGTTATASPATAAPAVATAGPPASASAATLPPVAASSAATTAAAQASESAGSASDGSSPIVWMSWPVIWSLGALLIVVVAIVIGMRARRLT
jgi:hypothetical protein